MVETQVDKDVENMFNSLYVIIIIKWFWWVWWDWESYVNSWYAIKLTSLWLQVFFFFLGKAFDYKSYHFILLVIKVLQNGFHHWLWNRDNNFFLNWNFVIVILHQSMLGFSHLLSHHGSGSFIKQNHWPNVPFTTESNHILPAVANNLLAYHPHRC